MSQKASNENMPVLEVNDIKRHYTKRKKHVTSDGRVLKHAKIRSVDGVSFTLNAGEVLGIIGESGCGKSTLGRLIVRLEAPTSGSILIGGQNAEQLIRRERLHFRRTTQMIFQNPFDTFDPRFSIEKIFTDTLKLHKIGENNAERRKLAIEKLEGVGLLPAESFLDRFPHELSGGQLQRISILRSMMLKPSVVVADEPVSMLDVSIRAEIINMLYNTAKEHNTALVFISHDISITRYISDRIAVMYLGKIVEMGSAEEVATNPKHPYTKALISNCASVDPRSKHKPIKLPGEPPTPIDIPAGCAFAPRCPMATPECCKNEQELRDLGGGRFIRCMKVL
jgi:peptide/nickel transport system ATP-binding protein